MRWRPSREDLIGITEAGARLGAQGDLELMAEDQVLKRKIPARSTAATTVRRTRSRSLSIRQNSNLPPQASPVELDRLLPPFRPFRWTVGQCRNTTLGWSEVDQSSIRRKLHGGHAAQAAQPQLRPSSEAMTANERRDHDSCDLCRVGSARRPGPAGRRRPASAGGAPPRRGQSWGPGGGRCADRSRAAAGHPGHEWRPRP